ncbi:MFS transporter [Actinoplanes sp. NPDC051633]|uniref:MFS transporter n=1 Tax=Actinoplanes sp. NPDC051633 TaxID=3155670 RepID=UPI00342899D1
MPLLLLAYLAFLGISLPDGLLGVSWPSMSASFGQPVGALGLVLPFVVVSSMLSSASTGALLARIRLGQILTGSVGLYAVALLAQSLAPAFWALIVAAVVLAAGSGAIDAALNAFAARRFNARQITWLHAVYGLGAAAGPLLFLATTMAGLSWRWAFGLVDVLLAMLTVVFACTTGRWPAVQQPQSRSSPEKTKPLRRRRPPAAVWSGAAVFALQTGVEAGTALWAYTFLTTARAVPPEVAAATTSGYWIALLLGRVVLGEVATRIGRRPILRACVVGMVVGATLLLLPGLAPVGGIILLGFTAAPMFPLLTLTTGDRVGDVWTDRAIGLQSAASTAGAATLPALIGFLIGPFGTQVIAPGLLVIAGMNAAVFAWITSRSRRTQADP